MADWRYCGDGHGIYAGTYIDLDQWKPGTAPADYFSVLSAQVAARIHNYEFPRLRLRFVEHLGVRYATIANTEDDARDAVEVACVEHTRLDVL